MFNPNKAVLYSKLRTPNINNIGLTASSISLGKIPNLLCKPQTNCNIICFITVHFGIGSNNS